MRLWEKSLSRRNTQDIAITASTVFAGAGLHMPLSTPFKGALLASNLLGICRISAKIES
jgi:hypothetical protein